ncbi:hypothetical protein BDR07DRAFT_706437 [Suillus spraguei]|nr:hypothetical protein BDR07DRAFT_706437 [Suillus spraguei]
MSHTHHQHDPNAHPRISFDITSPNCAYVCVQKILFLPTCHDLSPARPLSSLQCRCLQVPLKIADFYLRLHPTYVCAFCSVDGGRFHRKYGSILLIEKYIHLIRTAPFPAHWSLGYHQCRWNYVCVDDVRGVQNRTDEED